MSSTPADDAADDFAHSTVPEGATGSARKVFLIVAGSLCGLPVFVMASAATASLGYREAALSFLVGALVSGLLGACSAYAGATTRMTLAQLAETAFGTLGAQLVKLVIALSLIGWFGVIVSVLGATASGAVAQVQGWAVPSAAIAIPLCVLIALIARSGVGGLEKLGAVIIPLTFLLLAVAVGMTWPAFTAAGAAAAVAGTGAMSFGASVSAVVGGYIVGIIIQPDYGRYVRSPRRAGLAVFAALGVVYPVILALSAIPSAALAKPDLIAALIVLGIGLPAVALLLLGAWIDASACLYSGSLALAKLLPRLRFAHIVFGAGVVGMLLALVHAEQYFLPFLQLLGTALPPVAAVQCVAALWPRREQGPAPALRVDALLAWAAGIAAAVAAERGLITLTAIASVDSIIGAASVALASRAWSARRGAAVATGG